MDLSLTTDVDGRGAVVRVGGEVDIFTAPQLREQFAELIRAGHCDLIVDMENVDYLDSSGLGVLVGALKKVGPDAGSVRVVCSHERIIQVFRITGLASVFPIHASVAEADRALLGSTRQLVHAPAGSALTG